MEAKKVYEEIGGILAPKSQEEISAAIKGDPLAMLKRELVHACMKYWKKQGIRFGKLTTPQEMEKKGIFISSIRVSEGQPFMPAFSYLKHTQDNIYVELFGYIMLKSGKLSDNLNSISYQSVKPEWGEDIMKYM